MNANLRRLVFLCLVYAWILSCKNTAEAQLAVAWQPVSKEDLDLKDNPLDPGEAAMILYQEIQTDSAKSFETHFVRIKIFRDEGRKYANVEIPYFENRIDVDNIQARSVKPGGQPVEFNGAIFDKTVVRARRLKLSVKTFSLPDVGPGSIIEYSYRLHWHRGIPDVFKHPEGYILDGSYAFPAAHWVIQQDLFVRKTHLVIRPFSPSAHVEIRALHLPEVSPPERQPDGTFQFDVQNIPAFHEEEQSPPEEALQGRMELFYLAGYYSPQGYWSDMAKREFGEIQKFLEKSKSVHQEVGRLFAADDSPETKLRKLYARAQQIRYVSYEPTKTGKELKRENLKPNKTVDDVLTRGYGFANEINMLFVAMAREAGFNAFLVRVASRNKGEFMENVPDPSQLDAEVVEVWLDSQVLFLDPATLHCPFGLLPWEESDTQGIRLDGYRAGVVRTPRASSTDAVLERRASFKLNQDGSLQGTLDVTFLGQEALDLRLQGNDQDEAGRRKILEDEAKSWLPQQATVKMTSAAGWDETGTPLKAAFEIQHPGFATVTGRRLTFPLVLFEPLMKTLFESSRRENPVYFDYGFQQLDELKLDLPEGYQVESLPPSEQGSEARFASYQISAEQKGAELKISRHFVLNDYRFQASQYAELRGFYEYLRTLDEGMAVLHTLAVK